MNFKYKIYSLGCKVNQYDGEKLGGFLESAGFIFGEKDADLAIINACAVTKTAIRKSRQIICRAKKENPRAKIILTGCWPKIYQIDKKRLGIDEILKIGDFENLKIKKLFKNFKLKIKNSKTLLLNSNKNFPQNNQSRSRYFLKIQDGCEQFCAYCVIPYTRGKLRSRLSSEILKEAEGAVAAGHEEIVLCGIHLGLFGTNSKPTPSPLRAEPPLPRGEFKENLVGLLKKMVKIKEIKRIRLSSIEITEVSDELISFMAENKKMCRHFHLPLQSGSDKILKSMRRPYDRKYFLAKVKKIRRAMPDIAISTDIIVGFPGEDKKDFEDTFEFAEKIGFSRLHVFPFSAHEKTPAFKFPNKVKEEEIKNRSQKLRCLGNILEKKYEKRFLGKCLEVAIEAGGKEKLKGKSQYYFDTWFYPAEILGKSVFGPVVGKVVKIKFLAKNSKKFDK